VLGSERLIIELEVWSWSLLWRHIETEHTHFAHHGMPEPVVDPGHVLVLELTELELARVEGRFSTEEHAVHELPALLHRRQEIVVTAAPDTHSRGEPPEMAPAPSKHACPHGLRSRQEAEDVLEDAVRHGFYAASAASRRRHRRSLAVFPPIHSVEQVVGAD